MNESPISPDGQSSPVSHFPAEDLAAAKARLEEQGIKFGDWADQHGFSRRLVYAVLAGRKACRYGTTHEIAVKLGLKTLPQAAPRDQRLEGVRA